MKMYKCESAEIAEGVDVEEGEIVSEKKMHEIITALIDDELANGYFNDADDPRSCYEIIRDGSMVELATKDAERSLARFWEQ